jgi:hypothetical protein
MSVKYCKKLLLKGIVQPLKRAPANRKTEIYANRDLNKQEVGFLYEAARNFEVFPNIPD